MSDEQIRDLLAERLLRLERAQEETNRQLERMSERIERTNARLEQAIDVLGGMANVLVALKDGQERLVERVDRLADAITRGFTVRDEKIEEVRRRVERLERELRGEPPPGA